MSLQVERLSSADALLDFLNRRDPRWIMVPNDWVFRGQADAAWSLLPSAFRTNFRYGAQREFKLASTHREQVEQEAELVHRFLRGLNQQGLPPPNEAAARWIDRAVMYEHFNGTQLWRNWPPEDLAPLVALAQHHQIPTRLLDWTDNPLVAAYFGALEAAQKGTESFAVWAAHLGFVRGALRESPNYSRYRVDVVRPPRFSNPNLRAQSGVFTLLTDHARQPHDAALLPALDEIVSQIHAQRERSGHSYSFPSLLKLEVPSSEAPKVLRYLAYEWISGTYLYPGLDGVVRGIRERAFWDDERNSI